MIPAKNWTLTLLPVLVIAPWFPWQVSAFAAAAQDPQQATGSAVYSCQGDDEVTAADTPVTFTLVDQPTAVRAGEDVSLRGELTITFANTTARQSQLALATSASIDATDFGLTAEIAGETVVLVPTSVVGEVSPVDTPFRLTVELSFPPLTVPSGSMGDMTIRLPEQPEANPEQPPGPPEEPDTEDAAFTAELRQDSDLDAARNFTCEGSDLGADATVLAVPISAPQPAFGTDAEPPPTNPAPVSDNSATDSSPTLDPPPASAPAGEAPDAPEASVAAPVSAPLAAAAIPPATVTGKTFIPSWMLAIFAALLPGCALALAAWQRRQLQQLTHNTVTRP